MAVKIELEDSEVSLIKSALKSFIDEKKKIIDSGKYMGKKITKSAIETNMKVKKRLESLLNFFEG